MDLLYSALNLLLQLSGYTWAPHLSGLLTVAYNQLVTLTYGDLTTFIRVVKGLRAYWVHYMRTDKETALMTVPSFVGVPREEGSITAISDFRDSLRTSGTPISASELLFFDRVVIAFLSMDRLVTTGINADFETITTPGTHVPGAADITTSEIVNALNRLGINTTEFKAEYQRRCRAQGHILMSTAGPNGQATWTAHTDAHALMGNTVLLTAFQTIAEVSGMTRFLMDMMGTVSLPERDMRRPGMIVPGRLHAFEEWGGKTRIVAILDYWTQLILTPLHETIFSFLPGIAADGTFNQTLLAERVCQMTKAANKDTPVYSYDLTAATDRLPLALQQRVLEVLLGSSFATQWANLLVGREYTAESGKTYTYAVGQPMGAKSSWAMLALTHHVIVQVAAIRSNIAEYKGYALLGDDITLTREEISTAYLQIMSHYGVAINMSKSIVPSAGATPAAEICKRIFIDGEEITSLPVRLIVKTAMNGRMAPELQSELTRRNFHFPENGLLPWFAGMIDHESFEFLTILNVIPSSLTGLSRLPVTGPVARVESWYQGVPITPEDIENAFLYTAVTEQLNRLDILLKQTQVIAAAIETRAFGYHTQQIGNIGWSYIDPNHNIENIAASLPAMNETHPVVKVANAEMERIGEQLALLRTGDTKTVAAARRRLLDLFRNALVDSWPDASEARGQATRSLVQRSLSTLTSVVMHREGRRIDYTVLLSYLNRLWTVTWRLGSPVLINAVRSRITQDAGAARTVSTQWVNQISVSERFNTGPRKAQKSVSSITNLK
jgi:hypothetical protein